MDSQQYAKLVKYYHKMKACSQNSSKYKIYQQKIQYYLEGGLIPNSYPIKLNQANYNSNRKIYYSNLMEYNKNVGFSKQSTSFELNVNLGIYKKHGDDAKFDLNNTTLVTDYFIKSKTTKITLMNKLKKNLNIISYIPIEYTSPKIIYNDITNVCCC